jgi:hypothetical protein
VISLAVGSGSKRRSGVSPFIEAALDDSQQSRIAERPRELHP